MGIIKGGTASGNIPESEAFAVHYPGYPSSTSRAIQTLGGIHQIAKTRSSQPSSLELRFRPEDPYSHPAFGELRPCSSLLLRISKKMMKSGETTLNSEPNQSLQRRSLSESEMNPHNDGEDDEKGKEDSPARIFADIVARVPQAYQFDGMVDYQYVLPVHAEEARRKKRNWAEMEPNFEKGSLMDIDQEDFMMLVPPFFTLKDIPENLVLKPTTALHSKQKLEAVVQHKWEMDIEPCLGINFNIKEIPEKVNWEDHIPQASAHWDLQMAMSKLFDERPIWPRRSLQQRFVDDGLGVSDDTMKRLLFRAGYYFSKGPFGTFWIRKGYDPRKDPESRVYQRVDFRIPSQLRKSGDMNTTVELNQSWKNICEFRVFPSRIFCYLQLFELADDYIQGEIRKPSEQATCTIQTGWFSGPMLQSLKLRVSLRFLSIFPKAGVENLVKSVSNNFEKSKRLQALTRGLGRDEEEHPCVNRDTSVQSSGSQRITTDDAKIACNDDEENDNEVEDEEEHDEENELDENGLPHVAGEDADSSLQESSYRVGEVLSNNYLQELLSSYPFSKEGNNDETEGRMIHDDTSDGEYQIYEQDSGDDCYDDDDDQFSHTKQ